MRSRGFVVFLFLFLLAFSPTPSAEAQNASAFVRGEDAREADVAGIGPAIERNTLGTLVKWPDLRAPGRYRLRFRARFDDPFVAAIAVRTPGPHGLPDDARPKTYLSDKAGAWKDLNIEFTVEPGAAATPELVYPYVIRRVTRGEEVTRLQIVKSSIQVEKLPLPVAISWARPVKLRYKTNEQPALEIRLVNSTDKAQTVQVAPVVVDAEGAAHNSPGKTVTVPAGIVLPLNLPFALPKEGSYHALVEVRQAQSRLIDSRGDAFCVTDDAWRFWMSGPEAERRAPYSFGSMEEAKKVGDDPAQWAEFTRNTDLGVEAMRRDYTTGNEMFAWAYEDAVGLVPPSEAPYLAGQSAYRMLPKGVRYLSERLKSQGIVSSAYCNGEPFGWPGFEVFRQHPEWFVVTGNSQPGANFNTALIESYYRGDLPAGGDYPAIQPKYEAKSGGVRYIDFHISQLVKSAKMFGWDAYRYDAGPLPDEWFPFVQKTLAQQTPPVAIGNNLGIIVLGEAQTPRWKTFCSNGALLMEEAANRPFGQPTQHGSLRDYREWMQYVRRGSELTRINGGNYLHICQAGSWLMSTVGYAFSGHPYMYSIYKNPFGDTERFMLEYGYGLWEPATRFIDKPERFLSVKSANLLWWDRMVSERPRGAGRREVWVPLINPPRSEVTDSPNVGPADNVTVGFTPLPGEAVAAHLLTPEPTPQRIALPVRRVGNRVEVSVPRFWSWTNVVFDCRGAAVNGGRNPEKAATPKSVSKNAGTLKAAANAYDSDPNLETLLIGSNQSAYERGALIQDKTARSGWAMKSDPATDRPGPGLMWFGYTYGQDAGKSRVYFRLKVADTTSPRPVAVIRSNIFNGELSNVPEANNQEVALKGIDFKAPNVYQEFPLDFIKGERGFGDFAVSTKGVTALCFDGLRVVQQSRFTAAELMKLLRLPDKPANLALPSTPRIHEAGGLYRALWRVEDAAKRLPNSAYKLSTLQVNPQRTRVDGFPERWEDLYANSLIVLNNVSLKGVSTVGATMLRDWVQDGGTLFLMGDTHGLESGEWTNGPLASLLPVSFPAKNGTIPPAHPVRLKLQGDAAVYSPRFHPALVRPNARILLSGEKGEPLISELATGKGRIVVFTLSVLDGPSVPGATLWWKWDGWPALLGGIMQTADNRQQTADRGQQTADSSANTQRPTIQALRLVGYAPLPITPSPAPVTLTQNEKYCTLENGFVRLRVNLAKGARVDEYTVKNPNNSGRQLIPDDPQFVNGGLFMDHFWQQTWPGEFLEATYEAKIIENRSNVVTLEVSRVSQGYQGTTKQNDLRVSRRLTLRDDSPLLEVEAAIENVGKVGRLMGYWNQSVFLSGGDRDEVQRFYRPTLRGVSEAQVQLDPVKNKIRVVYGGADGFVRDPQQAWMASVGEKTQRGLAFVAKYDELLYLYNSLGGNTTEWQYNNVAIPPGKTWRTSWVMYPLSGLPRVDYASMAFAAGVETSEETGRLQIRLHLQAAGAALSAVRVSGVALSARNPKQQTLLTVVSPAQEVAVTEKPQTVTFRVAHKTFEPLILRFTLQGKRGGEPIAETWEVWCNGGYGYGENRDVAGDPLYRFAPPPRRVTFLKPERIVKTKNERPRVLVCKGLFADDYLPPAIFSRMKAEVVTSYFRPAGLFPATLSEFPASYEDLMAYDIITLINVDADALGAIGKEMLWDFVRNGGTLIYGGDFYAWGRGGAAQGRLSELLPVTFTPQPLARRPVSPLLATDAGRTEKAGKPLAADATTLYDLYRFTVKPRAQTFLKAGESPLLARGNVGAGRVFAVTGTALGTPPAGKRLWTKTPEWAAFLTELLTVVHR